jgi:hypothetical protein
VNSFGSNPVSQADGHLGAEGQTEGLPKGIMPATASLAEPPGFEANQVAIDCSFARDPLSSQSAAVVTTLLLQ